MEGAHPRSRGENAPIATTIRPIGGSSPLTRGKHKPLGRVLKALGLIPAHAGKTLSCSVAFVDEGAHPRSRGENQGKLTTENWNQGSSPLTRGKLGDHGLDRVPDGLIPAHAGKTVAAASRPKAVPAHPRSRGENLWRSHACRTRRGSSPLTRGKPFRALGARSSVGLIPAHAGKT